MLAKTLHVAITLSLLVDQQSDAPNPPTSNIVYR